MSVARSPLSGTPRCDGARSTSARLMGRRSRPNAERGSGTRETPGPLVGADSRGCLFLVVLAVKILDCVQMREDQDRESGKGKAVNKERNRETRRPQRWVLWVLADSAAVRVVDRCGPTRLSRNARGQWKGWTTCRLSILSTPAAVPTVSRCPFLGRVRGR